MEDIISNIVFSRSSCVSRVATDFFTFAPLMILLMCFVAFIDKMIGKIFIRRGRGLVSVGWISILFISAFTFIYIFFQKTLSDIVVTEKYIVVYGCFSGKAYSENYDRDAIKIEYRAQRDRGGMFDWLVLSQDDRGDTFISLRDDEILMELRKWAPEALRDYVRKLQSEQNPVPDGLKPL